jgi:DNA-binding response OmpR family regulator
MSKSVLVIDDDVELGELISAILQPIEISVHQAFTGVDGLKKAYALQPDLIILDVMMPEMNGFDVCSRLRELANTPILMLTARANESDMLHGFNVGADDFLKKPFNKNELQARVRALLRRSNNQHSGETSFVTSYIDPVLEIVLSSESVKLNGKIVDLSPKEFDLLSYLVRNQGKVVSHRELLREAWDDVYTNGSDTTSLYIYYLRNKIEDGKHGHQYIRTFWGRGYWFVPRQQEE